MNVDVDAGVLLCGAVLVYPKIKFVLQGHHSLMDPYTLTTLGSNPDPDLVLISS